MTTEAAVALVQCKECARQISDRAEMCPHCGYSEGSVGPIPRADDLKRCPNCSELVRSEALVCRYCRHKWGERGGCGPAVLSLLVPGLGQVALGDYARGLIYFVLGAVFWAVWLGWIIHIIAAFDASQKE